MTMRVELRWPTEPTAELEEHVHGLIRAVSELGCAIGWTSPPSRPETDPWLRDTLRAVAIGDAAICTATADQRLAAMGVWRREEADCFRHMAELVKVMSHPRARGLGLGRRVSRALVESAAAAGIETLHLGVRGNNHLAIKLYEEVGFRVWGRLPNVIEVGHERYDDVRMFLDLGRPAHVTLRGSAAGGPGSSPSSR